ncbi:MAG: ATP-dependent helicase, partial [Bacteroidales bacterium]|nr:ATP-dependent helicase [Bacteroidales bacterium]
VGDDDQNIYQFRGSNSDHMRSLLRQPKSVFYEMTSNYRSDRAIVNFANQFVQHIPQRMKTTPIEAASSENGKVDISPTIDWQNQPFRPDPNGTTAILTLTNEEALQSAYKIEQQGLHPILIQSTDGFRFINLAEVRFFMKQLSRNAAVITDKEWQQAKQRTEQVYERSRLLDTMRRFWHDYEQTHRTRYRTDLRQFLLESNIEDFLSLDRNSIFVSTIHKAKGREFDTVHLRLDSLKNIEPATLRTLYVGMTRARHHLHIYTDSPLFGMKPQQWASTTEKNIVIALSMHDVYLHFFINRKAQILNLRSGDELIYHNGYFMAPRADKSYGRLAQPPEDRYVALLSVSMRQRIADMEKKGYRVIRAMVSYVLAWRPRTDPQEVAVLLANIYLQSE